MNKPPKISIVTPSFNQGKYLERTILSVINQNYPNVEYSIIDGGSTDESPKIINKYKKYLNYWQSKKDDGQYQAIEIGFKHSTGEIFGWLNSDDILLPGSLSFLSKLFTRYSHLDWLTSQSFIINDQDQIVQTGIHSGKVPSLLRLGLYHSKCLGFLPQEGTFWRKSLWQKSGASMPKRHYCLDYDLWKKFAKHSPLVTLEAPLAAFRLNPDRKTNEMKKYYREIHPLLALLPRHFGIISRIASPILRYTCPRIYFNKSTYQWEYHGGLFSPNVKIE